MWFEKPGVQLGYKVLLFEFFLAVLINCVLNFWWAFLILKQVYRVITRGGSNDKEFCVEARNTAQENDATKGEEKQKIEMNEIKSDDV